MWERARIDDPAVRARIEHWLAALPGGVRTVFHEIPWLVEAEARNAGDVRIYEYRRDGDVRGYVPFVVQPWRMRFRVGEKTLLALTFERWHMNAGPVMATDNVHEEADALASLLLALRPHLRTRQIIYVEGLAVGSNTQRALDGLPKSAYRVLEPSPRYERSIARLPSTFDAYLGSMKAQTRQNLRNARRKLERHAAVRLVCFGDAAGIPEFVARAVAISRKTYQWRLLGLGLRDAKTLERTLVAMAAHGWTRCYLLECGGVATAFMIGYLHEGTYYYVDVGFDPDWEKWSVGTVLHMEVMKDLIEGGAQARVFDFSSGTGVHKKRFGNEVRLETAYVLLPAALSNMLAVAAYRAMNAFSDAAVNALDRLHLKTTIKRLVRRRAGAAAPDPSGE